MIKLDKDDATYFFHLGHFGFDCKCGSDELVYSLDKLSEGSLRNTPPNKPKGGAHSFYRNHTLMISMLSNNRLIRGGEPLVLKCSGCDREFRFTTKLYADLVTEIYQDGEGNDYE